MIGHLLLKVVASNLLIGRLLPRLNAPICPKVEMPELPEVETVRAGLAPAMDGKIIERADINRDGLRWPFPPNMAQRLTGARVLGLRRRSKYILADLSTGDVLLIHLGMSGRMLVSGDVLGDFVQAHSAAQKHDHVVLHMQGGGRVTFNDPRRFGAMDLFKAGDEAAHPLLAKLGPEPMGNAFDGPYLAAKLAGRKTPIKSALLDQQIVAGLGNIYVCEVLHRAGLAPTCLAGDVADSARLVPIIRDVLASAIAAGGSSLRDYRQTDGELGYFQHSFAVYGREGQACQTQGCTGIIDRIVQSGRSSFYCPLCQS
jgi:formamidopyrimidine-DNA glycosylase